MYDTRLYYGQPSLASPSANCATILGSLSLSQSAQTGHLLSAMSSGMQSGLPRKLACTASYPRSGSTSSKYAARIFSVTSSSSHTNRPAHCSSAPALFCGARFHFLRKQPLPPHFGHKPPGTWHQRSSRRLGTRAYLKGLTELGSDRLEQRAHCFR
eukprot:2736436-Rhodomonas_salina.2